MSFFADTASAIAIIVTSLIVCIHLIPDERD
jgi:hypothetical protein